MTYQDEYYDDYTDNLATYEDEHALQEDNFQDCHA